MPEPGPPLPAGGTEAARPTKRLRILLVSDYLPQDVDTAVHGAFQRLRRHIQSLQQLGEVDVVFLWPWHANAWNDSAKANLAALRRLWNLTGRCELVFSRFTCQLGQLRILVPAWLGRWSPGLAGRRNTAAIGKIAEIAATASPDLIFAHRMGAILPVLRAEAGKRAIVIDLDDVEHVRLRRQAARTKFGLVRLQLLLAAWFTQRLEAEALEKASTALVCSEADARFLRPLARAGRIALLPNAAAEHEALPAAASRTALFVGMVRYWPNAEGLAWLVREVWPSVRRALPQARLILAGLGSDELGLGDGAMGVETIGFAGDLQPLYAQARIALCPLHIASGTRIKIIEAAMYGRAAVSTGIGAEGLAFESSREIALADDAPAFAQACIDLLGDQERAVSMGMAARDTARRLYSPSSVARQLAAICAEALGR
ncbi:MAG TPA: glycosyltransferase family 4 protein [Dongiaceae bacterium]|nr:glycosyltransferase family 4 protein [Dongiaceae bacterium]